jgi:hypothetical protein
LNKGFTYEGRIEEFEKLCRLHKEYQVQITTSTRPEKVRARVGDLRELIKRAERLITWFGYDRYWDATKKLKTCAEMIAYWKAVVKVVTGVDL